MTNYGASPLAELADIVLCSTAQGSPLMGENAAARIAQLNILDAVFVAVAQRDFDGGRSNLAATMAAVQGSDRPMSDTSQPLVVVVGSLHYDIMVDAPERPRRARRWTGHAWRPKCGGKGGNQAVPPQAAAEHGWPARSGTMISAAFLSRWRGGVDRDRHRRAGRGLGHERRDLRRRRRLRRGDRVRRQPHLARRPTWMTPSAGVRASRVAERGTRGCQYRGRKGDEGCGWPSYILNAAPARDHPAQDLSTFVDILVVNAIEAEDMCGIAVDDLPSALAAARRLSSGFGTVVVTAGGAGVAGLQRGADQREQQPGLPGARCSHRCRQERAAAK